MCTRVILYMVIATYQTAGCVHIWLTYIVINLCIYKFAIFFSTHCILYLVPKMRFVNNEPGLNPLKQINVEGKMKRDWLNVAKIIICCNPLKESPQTEH